MTDFNKGDRVKLVMYAGYWSDLTSGYGGWVKSGNPLAVPGAVGTVLRVYSDKNVAIRLDGDDDGAVVVTDSCGVRHLSLPEAAPRALTVGEKFRWQDQTLEVVDIYYEPGTYSYGTLFLWTRTRRG